MGPALVPEPRVNDVIGAPVAPPIPETAPRDPVLPDVLPDGEVVEVPVPAGVPVAPALPVVVLDPALAEPPVAPLEAPAPVELVPWLLPDDVDPAVPESAWASPDPLAKAAPSPRVTAPAPSQLDVSTRRRAAWRARRRAFFSCALAFARFVARCVPAMVALPTKDVLRERLTVPPSPNPSSPRSAKPLTAALGRDGPPTGPPAWPAP